MHYQINISDKVYRLDLEKESGLGNRWRCMLNGQEIALDVVQLAENSLSIVVGGRSFQVRREQGRFENGADAEKILVGGKRYEVGVQDARSLRNKKRAAVSNAGPLKLRASMPGKVVRVLANKGDSVRAGAGVLVIEAMKMQNEVRSPKDGKVKELVVGEGMNVNAGDVLAVLE